MDVFNVIENCLAAMKRHPVIIVPSLLLFITGLIIGAGMSLAVFAQVAHHVVPSQGVFPTVVASLPMIIAVLIVAGVVSFIVGIYVKGAYIDLAHGWKSKNVSLSKSFGVSWSRYRDLFIYELTVVVINLIVAAILIGPLFYSSLGSIVLPYLNNVPITHAAAFSFLLLALVIGVIYVIISVILAILFAMGSPIVVLEKKPAMEALRQSIAIGKKSALQIFGLFVLEALVVIVLTVVAEILGLIPFIGFILAAIMYLVVTTFGELVVPMYYVTLYKKPATKPTRHRQPEVSGA